MRIGFDTLVENPLAPSSAINYLKSVLRALVAAAPEHEIFVFVSPKNRQMFQVDAPNVRYVNCFVSNENIPLRVLVQQLYLPLVALWYGIDVIHALSQIPLLATCATVVKTCGLHHHLTPEEYRKGSLAHNLRLIYRRLVWDASARRSTLVMANSQATQRDIVRLMEVPAEKTHVVYESVDDAFGTIGATEAWAAVAAEFNVGRPYVLYVSNLWRYKNPDGAIRAFAKQHEQYGDDLDLLIVGPDDYNRANELKQLAHDSNVGDRVHLLGRVPRSALVQLYSAAHVVFYPSLAETFGKPAVEGMRSGVPVVVADATSLPEIVGDAGLVADPRDESAMAAALHRAATDDELRASLVQKGLRRARDFSWEKTARETLQTCIDAVSARVEGTRTAAMSSIMTLLLFASLFLAIWTPPLANVAGLNLRIHQIVLPITILYLLWTHKKGTAWLPRYTAPLFVAWLAFLFWTLYAYATHTLTIHPYQKPIVSIGRAFLIAVNFCAYGAAYLLVLRRRDVRPAIDLLAVFGAAMAAFTAFLVVAITYGMRFPSEIIVFVWDWVVEDGKLAHEMMPRLPGAPNMVTLLAGIAVICLTMAGGRSRWRYLLCGFACVFGAIVAISRGALFAFAGGMVVVFVTLVIRGAFRELGRIAAAAGVIAVVVLAIFAVLPNHGYPLSSTFKLRFGQLANPKKYEIGTVNDRLALWSHLSHDIRRNPFRGYGIDSYQKYTQGDTTENFFLEVLHATGLWGFVPIIGVIAAVCLRAWRVSIGASPFALPILALLAGYLTMLAGALTNSLWGAGLFWAVFGVLAAGVDLATGRDQEVR